METQPVTEERKSFLQNDRLVVCSMLVIYSICILGAVGALFWGFKRVNQKVSADATSTAAVVSTQNAQATGTAIVRATEQAQYEFIDRFNADANRWRIGLEDNDYWSGVIRIKSGIYEWEIRNTKTSFVSWAEFNTVNYVKDFDIYVDTKVEGTNPGDVCSGFLFRVAPQGWDAGGYYFGLCNDGRAEISYHTEADGWETIAAPYVFGYANDWNRLEVIARGSYFKFLVNGKLIYEMDDSRREGGSMALVIAINEKVPAKIMFDNFGYQSR